MNHSSHYRAAFAVGEHSAAPLRRILRLYLHGAGLPDIADAAELALTELVANVVRHVPGRRCRICFLLRPGGVRVEVADDCPRLPTPVPLTAVPGEGDPLAEGGRGLLLVEAVTDRWGVSPCADGGGKVVWFECGAKQGGTGQLGVSPHLGSTSDVLREGLHELARRTAEVTAAQEIRDFYGSEPAPLPEGVVPASDEELAKVDDVEW